LTVAVVSAQSDQTEIRLEIVRSTWWAAIFLDGTFCCSLFGRALLGLGIRFVGSALPVPFLKIWLLTENVLELFTS
jgi:hypothetical protein